MTDLRQAAQQALEQVQEFKRRWWKVPAFGNKVNKATREAITNAHSPIFEMEQALRAALAEQQRSDSEHVEPVAWRYAVLDLIDECPGLTMEQDHWLSRRVKELDFHSAPQPRREPLIADEICDAWEFVTGHQIQFGPSGDGRPMFISTDEVIEFARAIEAAHGITEAPQPRREVELTDEDIMDALLRIDPEAQRLPPGLRNFARAVIAAYKAKQGETK